jgi:hypothetical protein
VGGFGAVVDVVEGVAGVEEKKGTIKTRRGQIDNLSPGLSR